MLGRGRQGKKTWNYRKKLGGVGEGGNRNGTRGAVKTLPELIALERKQKKDIRGDMGSG